MPLWMKDGMISLKTLCEMTQALQSFQLEL